MRTEIGTYLRNVQRDTRSFVLVFTVFTLVLSPFCLIASAHALPLLGDRAESPSANTDASGTELTAPEPLRLVSGTPTSTTPSDLKPQAAKLTWTATGTGEVQDTYDVRLMRTNDADAAGILTGEAVVSADKLSTAELSIDGLAEATYYWQVRSCMVDHACYEWSAVYALTIDGTAPSAPTAAVTSGQYDQNVKLSGTAEASSNVTANVDGKTCTTQVLADGIWSCTFEDDFAYGGYQATVASSDKAGNQAVMLLDFKVKELFVAPPITTEELPPVLDIAPIDTTPENKVYQQPISVIDSVNTSEVLGAQETKRPDLLPTTEGGIVQPSAAGWQVLGMPWFLWASLGGVLSAGWLVSSGRLNRSFS